MNMHSLDSWNQYSQISLALAHSNTFPTLENNDYCRYSYNEYEYACIAWISEIGDHLLASLSPTATTFTCGEVVYIHVYVNLLI